MRQCSSTRSFHLKRSNMFTNIAFNREFKSVQWVPKIQQKYITNLQRKVVFFYRFKYLQCRQQNWMIMKMQFEAEAPQQAVSLSKDLTWLPLSRWAEGLKGSTQHHLSQHSFKLPSSRTEISSFFMLATQPAQL